MEEKELYSFDYEITFKNAMNEHIVKGIVAEDEDEASEQVSQLKFGHLIVDCITCIHDEFFMIEGE
ncbi:hypothetical protein ACWS7L_08150 [Exiguobacterium artemiae]